MPNLCRECGNPKGSNRKVIGDGRTVSVDCRTCTLAANDLKVRQVMKSLEIGDPKPCPFCGAKILKMPQRPSWAKHIRHRSLQCPLAGFVWPVKSWNQRPEEAPDAEAE